MSLLDDMVQQLVDAAFAPSVPRLPRSPAYRSGVLDGAYHGFGRDNASRYATGTAECDAYLAGLEEGHALVSQYRAKQEGPLYA